MKELLYGVGCLFVAVLIIFIPMLYGYMVAEDDEARPLLAIAVLVEIGVITYCMISYI